ncbi:MAG TPA: carboxypeptidase-like regulatory domain-containing protein [Hymenobacter sp.]|jgi:hypothetical protein|uniref:carboxypeptidase-like regulatory domain-containing protein n=1 Tax=Hymenobacter sp. TaxID=1898978 RepID=UPI002ED78D80
MSAPVCFAIRLTSLVLVSFLGGLMGCRSEQTIHVLNYAQGRALSKDYLSHYKPRQQAAKWLGPPATFSRFRRTNPAGASLITGYVDVQQENGKFTPLPGAIITIDDAHTFADQAGNYVQIVGPGRHHVRAGWVGMLWSEAPSIRVEPGDSIQINFHVLPEFRPTIN